MSRVPVSPEIMQVVIKRVKSGEAVIRILSDMGAPRRDYHKFLDILHKEVGIKLRKGPRLIAPSRGGTVGAFSEHFDKLKWPGAADEWRQLRPHQPLEELARRFGYRTRQRAQQVDYDLTDGKPKPRIREKPAPLLRPDVTLDKIRPLAQRGYHLTKVAKLLQTSTATVRQRMQNRTIDIPKYMPPQKRPDITPERVREAAQSSRSVLEMSKKLRTSHMTIYRRAERNRFPLPHRRLSMKA